MKRTYRQSSQIVKACPVCGDVFVTFDARRVYCYKGDSGQACKQAAYRLRRRRGRHQAIR